MIMEIDYECLMDALLEADEDGRRIRVGDSERAAPYLAAGAAPLRAWSVAELDSPKIGIIGSGLMAGLYCYSISDERAAVWIDGEQAVEPLPRPRPDEVLWDVVLSYSSEDLSTLVLPLRDALTARGVRTYVLDVTRDPRDPVWSIRYRHALYRSHYAVAVLGPRYLERAGTQVELRDMVRVMKRVRRGTYFYPLIGLQDPAVPGVVPAHVPRGEGPDDLSFAWTHVPGLRSDTAPDVLARFFRSLARNAAGKEDLEWVGALGAQVEALRAVPLPDGWGVELYVRHPTLTWTTLLVRAGAARYMGVHEPPEDAVPCRDALAEVAEILARPPAASEPSRVTLRGEAAPAEDVGTEPPAGLTRTGNTARHGDATERKPPTGGASPLALVARARQLLPRGEHEGALVLAAEAVAAEPDCLGWAVVGRCHVAGGRTELGRVALGEALRLALRTGAPLAVEVRAELWALGEARSPEPAVDEALEVAPPESDDDGYRPATHDFGSVSEAAAAVLNRPGGVRDWLDAARGSAEAGDSELAVAILQGVNRRCSSLKTVSDALYLAGLIRGHGGRLGEARRFLARAVRCHPDNDAARRALASL